MKSLTIGMYGVKNQHINNRTQVYIFYMKNILRFTFYDMKNVIP